MTGFSECIREYLVDEMGLETDIGDNESLFSNKLLDSIDILKLIIFLEQKFSIKFNPLDISLDVFDSISKIATAVEKRA